MPRGKPSSKKHDYDLRGHQLNNQNKKSTPSETQKTDTKVKTNSIKQYTVSTCDPNMAGNSSEESDCVVTNKELKAIMLRLEGTLNKRMDDLQIKVESLNNTVKQNEGKIKDLEHAVTRDSDEIQGLEQVIVPRLDKRLTDQHKEMERRLLLAEIRDRKYNLLFYGAAPEKPGEHVVGTVRDFLVSDFNMTPAEADGIFICNCHRLPRRQGGNSGPDPIIVKFSAMLDRDYVLEAARNRGFIKDRKPVMVYTDLPPEMKRRRGALVAEAKKLRQNGQSTRIRVIQTEVFLEFRDREKKQGQWSKFAG